METNKIKVILVDDHHIFRDGIKAILNSSSNIQVVAETDNYKELTLLLKNGLPDIIILDISLPEISGLEIAERIKNIYNDKVKILILSMYNSEEFIINAIKAGAKGYLPKNTNKKELINAIEAIHQNEEFFSPLISNVMLKSFISKAKGEQSKKLLSTRELEIIKLHSLGISNQEIASKLCISVKTVESHKNHIMQKLNIKSTVDIVKFAIKNNIIDL
ncbi:MAG: hypothetical protein A2X02_00560 [Bacteroidetes bacterium GWF2_29_10]|nr:MAG: hypothetical protein A2X02_00560 [Bacteroidetes bacterium GWF2_29_10]